MTENKRTRHATVLNTDQPITDFRGNHMIIDGGDGKQKRVTLRDILLTALGSYSSTNPSIEIQRVENKRAVTLAREMIGKFNEIEIGAYEQKILCDAITQNASFTALIKVQAEEMVNSAELREFEVVDKTKE